MTDEFYLPEGDSISAQSPDNKQGRASEPLSPRIQDEVRSEFSKTQERSYAEYRRMIEKGIARELARINLPLSLYTEWYWQIDLHNLFHFLRLRMDPHAQYEIREYARCMFNLARHVCPAACEAFEDYKVYGEQFSRNEMKALKLFIDGSVLDHEQLKEKTGLSSGEAMEFLQKIGRKP
jgi:thymidylate synthase (FAD)